jgi:pimeloyl-ACP methyl ester carboxylesterase
LPFAYRVFLIFTFDFLLFMSISQQLALRYIRTKFKVLSTLSKRKAAESAFELFCTPQYRNRKKPPHVFEKAEKLQFSFEGYTVRGYRWNHSGGNNKKALILHGFESSVINFDRYVEPLIKKGYEVLAFDAPAHGRSSGRKITVLIYKDLVGYIWKNFGPIDSFIAHSFGGLALCLALEEIPHSSSTKIVLIAPAAETQTAIDNFFKLLRLDSEVREHFDNIIEEKGKRPPRWYSVSRAASHIKAEVLFLQDKNDHMTPLSDVEPIIEKNHPNFHFVISEGLGHRRIYRDSKSAKTILDFL